MGLIGRTGSIFRPFSRIFGSFDEFLLLSEELDDEEDELEVLEIDEIESFLASKFPGLASEMEFFPCNLPNFGFSTGS